MTHRFALSPSVDYAITQLPSIQETLETNGLRKSVLSTVAAGYFLGDVFKDKRKFAMSPDEWHTFTRVFDACPTDNLATDAQFIAVSSAFLDTDPHSVIAKAFTMYLPLQGVGAEWHEYWGGTEVIDYQLKRSVDNIKRQYPTLTPALLECVTSNLVSA